MLGPQNLETLEYVSGREDHHLVGPRLSEVTAAGECSEAVGEKPDDGSSQTNPDTPPWFSL